MQIHVEKWPLKRTKCVGWNVQFVLVSCQAAVIGSEPVDLCTKLGNLSSVSQLNTFHLENQHNSAHSLASTSSQLSP